MCMQCVATASTSAAPTFAAIVAILGGMTWRHRRAERAAQRASQPVDNAHVDR
ncbi:MAG: hypothetical protein ACKN9D_15335 [Actinomycetales bacterium]|jgi:hypothetical protein